ncbi:MAG: efflux RND transporter periplasmic adaptor subunit [Myxococcota bacterium]
MPNFSRLVLLVVLAGAPAVVFAHGGEDHGDKPKAQPAPAVGDAIHFPKEAQFLLGVRTEPVAVRQIETRLVVPGKVVPRTDKHAQVFPPVAGRVLAPNSRLPLVGERVKRGQLLAILEQSLSAPESTQLVTERIKAETTVSQAKAALEQARRDLERVKSLAGVVAEKEVQKAELAVKVAEQELERAVQERNLYTGAGPGTGGRLTQFRLVAPLDGVLVEAHATVGEQVDPSRVLFTVLDASVVWVEANVFADDVAQVERAAEALIHVEAYPDQYFPARLFNLSQLVDESTRTVKAIFEVPNGDRKLRPGMFAEVAIGAGAREETLAVPDAAIVQLEGRKVVYVHTAPEEFVARDVSLGAKDGAYHALKQGLEEGARVVTVGTFHLRSAGGGR